MDTEQVLAFRLARSGLATRDAGSPALAAACPASDFSRDAALLALGARRPGLTRDDFERAIAGGDLVLAHAPRGAIHALAPDDLELYGRALIATDDRELGAQLGRQVQRITAESGIAPTEALEEVAGATGDALADGRALGKNELHEALRSRVREQLMPWCKGCQSHHVAPMLWRHATVAAGARLDTERRYFLAAPGRVPPGGEALLRFLSFYGPGTPAGFAEWAGVGKPQAQRLWAEVQDGLTEVDAGGRQAWIRSADMSTLESPPPATGVCLIPAGDPYLQKANRPLLAPDAALRKRLFRPVASPGAVLRDGVLAGLWRGRLKGRRLEVTVERTGRLARAGLEDEARRMAELRGAAEAELVLD